jgi:hypothetical protein
MGHKCLFRGRPVHFNSIFVDGFAAVPANGCLVPQRRGPNRPIGRQKQIVTVTRTASRALQEPSVKCREKCFFLDKPLSWMSPVFGRSSLSGARLHRTESLVMAPTEIHAAIALR